MLINWSAVLSHSAVHLSISTALFHDHLLIIMANSDTIQSGAVGCSGIRGWFNKLRAVGSGSLMSSGWYLRVERCEEGSGIRDSLMVEGRNSAGQVLERRELQGILYDEATGEEEEWVVDVGSDKERRAWGVACKARQ